MYAVCTAEEECLSAARDAASAGDDALQALRLTARGRDGYSFLSTLLARTELKLYDADGQSFKQSSAVTDEDGASIEVVSA